MEGCSLTLIRFQSVEKSVKCVHWCGNKTIQHKLQQSYLLRQMIL